MPLYDIRCQHCDGIFEKRLAIATISTDIPCEYCQQDTPAKPMLTAQVQLKTNYKWQPQSKAEQLAGKGITGPGTAKGATRNSVLHNCKGMNCSVCGL
jgi:putative FmdB family regulatory protein